MSLPRMFPYGGEQSNITSSFGNDVSPQRQSQQQQQQQSSHIQGPYHPQSLSASNSIQGFSEGGPDQLLDDEHGEDGEGGGKRRRVQRACDICRKKKVRCDGLQPDKGKCSHCATYGHDCTFVDAAKRRAPPRSYVDALEARMDRADQLLMQLLPGTDINDRIGAPPQLPGDKNEDKDVSKSREVQRSSSTSSKNKPEQSFLNCSPQHSTSSQMVKSESMESFEDDEGEDEDDIAFIRASLAETKISEAGEKKKVEVWSAIPHLPPPSGSEDDIDETRVNTTVIDCSGDPTVRYKNLVDPTGDSFSAPTEHQPSQFLGKASDIHLVPLLQKMKAEDRGSSRPPSFLPQHIRPKFWRGQAFYDFATHLDEVGIDWPDKDLEEKLLQAYFSRNHHHRYPIVNEVIFRRSIADPKWKQDPDLVRLNLAIYTVASRSIDDPRVLSDDDDQQKEASGIKWFRNLVKLGIHFPQHGATIAHVQSLLVLCTFMLGTPLAATSGWTLLAVAVRLLQDAGAHRRLTARKLGLSLVTAETFRRMWWTVYSLDRLYSSTLGRPMCIQDEDFDLEDPLPLNDDLVVLESETGIKQEQPEGNSCVFSGFIVGLRLFQILGRTLRTIYAISKSRASRGFVGSAWDAFIVAEIDSALNQWLNQVPPHLRYAPDKSDDDWLIQSSNLFLVYYHAQVLVHRPFVPKPTSKSSLTFPSLAIVSNAARSAIHILSRLHKRNLLLQAGCQIPYQTFSFCLVLLIVIWSAKRNGARISESAMTDAHSCLEILGALEDNWLIAGKMNDVLNSIIETSELPVLKPETAKSRKRQANDSGDDIPGNREEELANRRRDNLSNSSSASALPFSTTELVGSLQGSSSSSSSNTYESPASVGTSNERSSSPSTQNKGGHDTASQRRGQDSPMELTQAQQAYALYLSQQQERAAAINGRGDPITPSFSNVLMKSQDSSASTMPAFASPFDGTRGGPETANSSMTANLGAQTPNVGLQSESNRSTWANLLASVGVSPNVGMMSEMAGLGPEGARTTGTDAAPFPVDDTSSSSAFGPQTSNGPGSTWTSANESQDPFEALFNQQNFWSEADWLPNLQQ